MEPDRAHDDALDAVTDALRDRLLAEAGHDGPGGPQERVRALVDCEVGSLDDVARTRLASQQIR